MKFPAHFFNGLKTDNKELIEFKKYVKEKEGLTILLTNRMGLLYNMFMFVSTIIKFIVYEKPSKYVSFLYHYQLNDTVGGVYEINYDGYAVGLIRLARVYILLLFFFLLDN